MTLAAQAPRLGYPRPKPPRPLLPKPRRLLQGKHMTIALGILATDGIVLAADTEMSWGNARKTEGAKIAVVEQAGIAIAGAGDVGLMDALS